MCCTICVSCASTHTQQDLLDWQPEHGDSTTINGERLLLRATGHQIHTTNGIGLFYSPSLHGTPQPLVDFVSRLGSVPTLTFIITNRFVSVPHVPDQARLLIEPLTVPGFYHVVARYGYMEVITQDQAFVTSIITQLRGLLTDALHGLSATSQPGQPNLAAAVAELNAAPLFMGEVIAEKHSDNLMVSEPSSGNSLAACDQAKDPSGQYAAADAVPALQGPMVQGDHALAKAESVPLKQHMPVATFTAISLPHGQLTTCTRCWVQALVPLWRGRLATITSMHVYRPINLSHSVRTSCAVFDRPIVPAPARAA